jgi:putative hydrolase of the HAD superfamily
LSITTILSDIGNVVAMYDDAKADSRLAELCGRPAAMVRAAIHDGSPSVFRRFMTGEFDRDRFRRLVCEGLGIPESTVPQDRFEHAFGDVFTPNGDVMTGWQSLRRDMHVTITAVSNMDPIRWQRLERMGIPLVFDHLVLSFEEKLVKPSEELLLRALERSGAKAEETLFVDDQAKNFPPAAALGIPTHLYTDASRLWEEIGRLGVRSPLKTT